MQQKNEGENDASCSFQVDKAILKTLKPEFDTSEMAWDDCASVLSCLTIDTKDTIARKGAYGIRRYRKKEVLEDLPSSSSESEEESVAVAVVSAPLPEERSAEETIALIEVTIEKQEERLNQLEHKIVPSTKQGREKLQQGNKKAAVRAMKKIKMLQFEKRIIQQPFMQWRRKSSPSSQLTITPRSLQS